MVPALSTGQKALAINPHMATALATKGALLLAQVRSDRDALGALETARKAAEALKTALRENPLLSLERGAALKEAEKLGAL